MAKNPAEAGIERLLLLGCGKMGGALLDGWLSAGFAPQNVAVLDPAPSERLQALASEGLVLNPEALPAATVALIAVKPQRMAEALPRLAPLAGGACLFVSIAAGTPLAAFERALPASPIVRAMPNTPAAVGHAITALIGNGLAGAREIAMAETLMAAVGATVRLSAEDQMDAVTAVSGSGPAYVFHLIEALAAAGEAEGLAPDLARRLARATVEGAGALSARAAEDAATLRENVTSPGGTTAAGLGVLMDELPDLMRRTVAAAAARGRALGE
ncbi:MAG: pyrroline-5-carboxylate reductase [Pseudomonadota bacterium]